jgi:hypothetical protein
VLKSLPRANAGAISQHMEMPMEVARQTEDPLTAAADRTRQQSEHPPL